MSFPSSIPSYTGFTSSHTLAVDMHAAQHNQEQADIVALSTKTGTGASTPVASTLLRGNGSGTSTWTQANLSTDVTGLLPIANGGTGSNTAAGALVNLGGLTLQQVYPVNCIYTETTGVNPGTTFGFGTWIAFGAGRVLIGNGTSDQAFTAGSTGGESNHTLSSTEMPSHSHTVTDPGHLHTYAWGVGNFGSTGTNAMIPAGFNNNANTSSNTTGVTNQNTGGGGAHNNLQPYIVVYFWQRTA